MSRKIVVLGTGGTIAGLSRAGGGYDAGALGVSTLLDAGQGIECIDVYQIDSKDVMLVHWCALLDAVTHALAREDVAGVVITHGTDTMEETAWLLQVLASHARKPVVLTGAMRPADHASPDGPANLQDALAVVSDAKACGRGVLVVMNGQIHAAAAVRKVHGWALDAFSSGACGALGQVRDGLVTWFTTPPLRGEPDPSSEFVPPSWQQLQSAGLSDAQKRLGLSALRTQAWPWVDILTSGAQADVRTVQALVAAGVAGLVVAGTGSGTWHAAWSGALAAPVRIPVVLTSASEMAGFLPEAPTHWLGASALGARKTRLTLALWCLFHASKV